jgi:hypothetical protein
MGTRAKRPKPALDLPIRRWREGEIFAGMGSSERMDHATRKGERS